MKLSRLGPRNPKRPGGVTGDLHGAWSEQENVESDEDGAGQVKEGLLAGGRTRVDIEHLAWESRGDGRFRWFGPQNHQGGRFPGLGLKTRGGAR
jgi:hypothetical protein